LKKHSIYSTAAAQRHRAAGSIHFHGCERSHQAVQWAACMRIGLVMPNTARASHCGVCALPLPLALAQRLRMLRLLMPGLRAPIVHDHDYKRAAFMTRLVLV